MFMSIGFFSCPILCEFSSGASRGAPHRVATLRVRKGAFDALNKGSVAPQK